MKTKYRLYVVIKTFKIIIVILVLIFPIFCLLNNSFMTTVECKERFIKSEYTSDYYTYSSEQPLYPYPFSLDQYKNLFIGSEEYFYLFGRSFTVALIIVTGQIIFAVPIGVLAGLFRFRGRYLLLSVYAGILFLPTSATLLPNYIILRSLNLLDSQAAIIYPSFFSPLGALLLTVYIASVPHEVIDAALLETKSLFVIIRHIIIPQIIPGLNLLFLLSFAEAWSMVEAPRAFMDNSVIRPLSASLNSIFSSGKILNYAGVLLYLIPSMILLLSSKNIMEVELFSKHSDMKQKDFGKHK